MRNAVLQSTQEPRVNYWDTLAWRRQIETFSSPNDEPIIAKDARNSYDAIW
jgi:hypothetical protein